MFTLVMLIVGQCVFAGIVVFVLKNLLNRELMRSALEKFESCPSSLDIKEIAVYSAKGINDEFKSYLESIRKRKFTQASFKFQENIELKGGVVIALGETLLDFSLSTRLQNFWS